MRKARAVRALISLQGQHQTCPHYRIIWSIFRWHLWFWSCDKLWRMNLSVNFAAYKQYICCMCSMIRYCKSETLQQVFSLYLQWLQHMPCEDPERGDRLGSGPPMKHHKTIGFLSNTGPDPLKILKANKPAFNVGPSSANQQNAI